MCACACAYACVRRLSRVEFINGKLKDSAPFRAGELISIKDTTHVSVSVFASLYSLVTRISFEIRVFSKVPRMLLVPSYIRVDYHR